MLAPAFRVPASIATGLPQRGGRHTNACPGLSCAGARNKQVSESQRSSVYARRREAMSDCRDIVVCLKLFAVVGFGYVVVIGMGRVLVCDVSGV